MGAERDGPVCYVKMLVYAESISGKWATADIKAPRSGHLSRGAMTG